MKIAVISDIHVGKKARAKDLCPPTTEGYDSKVDDKYCDKFLKFVKKHVQNVDYLILPGDITNSADPPEFEIASEFLRSAADALDIKMDKVVFVPGNHDVDWSVLEKYDPTGVRKAERYVPICGPRFCFKPIVDRAEGDLFKEPHFTTWNFPDLLVLGYNSAHHDEPKKLHHGLITPEHIEEAKRVLNGLPIQKDQVRLFLVHHHPVQYDDPTPEDPDISIMVNAEHLQVFLREYKFDIVVHGHKHLPRFTTHSLNGSPEIAILCSGSFSVQIDTRWAGTISNQFHLIEIEGRDEEEQMIMGRVTSWSYNYARDWNPSDVIYDGIPHIEPFGIYIRPSKLEEIIRPILEKKFANQDYIEWAWVTDQDLRLRYLRPEILIRVLDNLSKILNFKRVHETPEKIILLKNKSHE